MRALTGVLSVAAVALLSMAGPASAWWRYAEWGKSEEQIVAASQGQAVPCRAGVPVCAATPTGSPKLFVESVNMLGLPASAAFVFDAGDLLIETVVLFANTDIVQSSGLLQGVLGQPAGESTGVRTWRDERRGTIITAIPADTGTKLVYRPADRKN